MLPAHRRADALDHVSRRLTQSREELARLITAEGGTPIRSSRIEVDRAAATFRLASEEARRWPAELQRLDTDTAGEGRIALNRRVSRGPVLGITPFNFPLDLVAHEVAPALAVGAPIVLNPAPSTPLSALFLGDLLAETDLPDGSWSVLTVPNDRMDALVADPRLPVVPFTGSGPVGCRAQDPWMLRRMDREPIAVVHLGAPRARARRRDLHLSRLGRERAPAMVPA